MGLLKQDVPWKESQVAFDDFLQDLSKQTRALITRTLRKRSEVSILATVRSSRAEQMLAKALSDCFESKSFRLDIADFIMKMLKNYDYDCNKKSAGNQGEVSAGGKSEGNAESAGPKDKSIPQSRKDGCSPAEGVPPGNEFKVISPKDIGVTFRDIGGMDEIKKLLQQLVIVPHKRPDLFKRSLPKPCKGILLFGPPGAGKTLLAKAIATESGASFINCSMSTITSNVPGEAAKNVRALFARAAEVAPTIIFIDEVDSMLSKREHGEPEFMRILKNEFMSSWDGFMTRPGEQILVLGTTSKPGHLDEAAIRRFERRVMVGLPSAEEREEILKFFLSKEKTDGIDIHDLARMTGEYTGSDLERLCTAAAFLPVWEFILNDLERKKKAQEKENSEEGSQAKEDNTEKEESIAIRALTMDDMKAAKKLVAPSFPAEGAVMNDLKEWNELYGEGGSRKKQQLTCCS